MRGTMSKGIRILLVVIGVLLLVILVGPFLVPVRPLEDTLPREALATEESQFVEVPFEGTDGIEFHYRLEEGEGERAFVLLHGFASNLYTWDAVFELFSAHGTTLAYDRLGFGLTERLLPGDWSGATPYSPEAALEHTIALMDEFGIERAVIVGNSAGGTQALRLALEYPERVEALILVDPAVYTGGGSPGFVRALADTPQMQRVGPLVSRLFRSLGESLLERAYYDTSVLTAEEMEQAALTFRVDDWDRAFWEFTAASQLYDLPAVLDQVTAPTLVITGEEDRIVPAGESIRLAGELPDADLVVIPACGHVPQQECEGAFMEAVDAFLAGLDES